MGEHELTIEEMLLIEIFRLENQIKQEVDNIIDKNILSEVDVHRMQTIQQRRNNIAVGRKDKTEQQSDFLQKQVANLKELLIELQVFLPN